MLWHKLRKAIFCLLFFAILVFFLFAFEATLQDTGSHALLSSSYSTTPQQLSKNYEQKQQQQHDAHPTAPKPTCQLVRNVAFIKTHKAGSSTVANILQRFGVAHNLTFALPNKPTNVYSFNYIVKPGELLTPQKILPLPGGQEYNILWSHSIYNRTAFRQIMPKSTVYISILREPFQQFVSSFEYYGVAKSLVKMNSSYRWITNPISAFLQYPMVIRHGPARYGYIRNKQAQDLGFGLNEFYNLGKMHDYIKQLDNDFVSFMIMEHFAESLLLLRHQLCWELKDILYIPKNRNKNKPNRTFSDFDRVVHKKYSNVDYNIYNHFLEKFQRVLKAQSVDFFQELTHYKSVLEQVSEHCPVSKSFTVPSTKWNPAFNVTLEDCKLMGLSELAGLVLLRHRTGQGVKPPDSRS